MYRKRLKSGCDLCIPLKLTLVVRVFIPSDGAASYGASAETVRPPSHMKALVSQFSFGAVLISGRCLGVTCVALAQCAPLTDVRLLLLLHHDLPSIDRHPCQALPPPSLACSALPRGSPSRCARCRACWCVAGRARRGARVARGECAAWRGFTCFERYIACRLRGAGKAIEAAGCDVGHCFEYLIAWGGWIGPGVKPPVSIAVLRCLLAEERTLRAGCVK